MTSRFDMRRKEKVELLLLFARHIILFNIYVHLDFEAIFLEFAFLVRHHVPKQLASEEHANMGIDM